MNRRGLGVGVYLFKGLGGVFFKDEELWKGVRYELSMVTVII